MGRTAALGRTLWDKADPGALRKRRLLSRMAARQDPGP